MRIVIFVVLVASFVGGNVAQSYGYPAYPSSPYAAPAAAPYKTPSYQTSYNYAPMPYKFAWAVKDDYTYNDYAHEETADDKGYVTGSYRVLLPDGRTQIVTYRADDYSGYVADVKYEGYAKYDSYKPSYDSYKPSYSTYPTYNKY